MDWEGGAVGKKGARGPVGEEGGAAMLGGAAGRRGAGGGRRGGGGSSSRGGGGGGGCLQLSAPAPSGPGRAPITAPVRLGLSAP